MSNTAKSAAQERLADRLTEAFPYSIVRQEVPIAEMIRAAGYSKGEVERTLGHRVHRMFCDVVVEDADSTLVFEYNGEQHYRQVRGMTTTADDLAWDQALDREKADVLLRIGVPIVQVPFDAYIDDATLNRMIEDAIDERDGQAAQMSRCDGCGRAFPASELTMGRCQACIDKARNETEAAIAAERDDGEREYRRARRARRDETPEEREERLAEARAERKARYAEWKSSPEYAEKRERERERRREQGRKRRAEQKAQHQAEKRRRRYGE